jgi:hypothetical protein
MNDTMKTIGLMGLIGLMVSGCDERRSASEETQRRLDRIEASIDRSEANLADAAKAGVLFRIREASHQCGRLDGIDVFSAEFDQRLKTIEGLVAELTEEKARRPELFKDPEVDVEMRGLQAKIGVISSYWPD